ncbi:MAG TPA: DnaB-like helicase N-terminal domain-containing protein, partial [Pyrinomonadaceae bacterium]|nr:DnaB-like helicase N-terminal domain-containing protein [Pyrinomonadaceae bacterium]
DDADPDDFIRKNGVTEYQQRRGAAQPHIQFVIDQALRDRNLHSPADKAAAVEETLPFVRAVRNRIQKREYFDIAMDSLRVQRDQRRELWQQVGGRASADPTAVQKVITQRVQATVAEEKLLGLLLGNHELRNIILPRLEPSDYEGLATEAIFRALESLEKEDQEISFDSLSAATADNSAAAAVLPRLLMNESAESFDESLADANSCLAALRLMKLDREIDELSARIADADRAGEDEERDRLAMKKLELSKQRSTFLPPGKAAN